MHSGGLTKVRTNSPECTDRQMGASFDSMLVSKPVAHWLWYGCPAMNLDSTCWSYPPMAAGFLRQPKRLRLQNCIENLAQASIVPISGAKEQYSRGCIDGGRYFGAALWKLARI